MVVTTTSITTPPTEGGAAPVQGLSPSQHRAMGRVKLKMLVSVVSDSLQPYGL